MGRKERQMHLKASILFPARLPLTPQIVASELTVYNEACVNYNPRLASTFRGFPDSSSGKESICNSGYPSSIPGSRRYAGKGIGYPLQYSWVSPVAQLVKNPPEMQETWG